MGKEPSPALFKLYRIGSCVCIETKKQTKTVIATERQTSTSAYQVFWSRSNPKREIFRVKIGEVVDSALVRYWNYGIADEADFNGDGVPDYSWYGGDDTGQNMYLFLSSGSRYKAVNVLKTVQAAWVKRFHKAAPDLGEADGDYDLRNIRLERSALGLSLSATITSFDEINNGPWHFLIGEADFKP